MTRTCPKCSSSLTSLPRGAYRCARCGGLFVPQSAVSSAEIEDAIAPAGKHDAETGRCPLDHTILSRAEIILTPELTLHLDRCGSCRGIWFDAGEWRAMADHHLLENIDQFWTAAWRARQRHQQEEQSYDRRLRESFGPELYASLQEIAAKLKGHDRRSQALAFLREASDD